MKRLTLLCLLAAAGCGEGMDINQEAPVTAADTQALERTPAIPTTPINLARYAWGRPLYPATVTSAYTVYFEDATDSRWFVAYGFDVNEVKTLFYARGRKDSDLRPFLAQVESDINAGTNNNLPNFSSGAVGQIVHKDPPPPPGIAGQRAWQAALSTWRANNALFQP